MTPGIHMTPGVHVTLGLPGVPIGRKLAGDSTHVGHPPRE